MVAVIKTGHSIHRIFNYNENKVKEGVAQCIGERNYPIDLDNLTLSMKLNRLLKQAELNEKCKRNSVHISLNFDPSENHLSKEQLMSIANTYMDKIGFGNQPYLVYQHHDAGHPHIHIVSIKVRENGERIDMQNIGRNQSEKSRKEIEKDFGLITAEKQNKSQDYKLKAISPKVVEYGKTESKRAIQNILDSVLHSYKYSSLAEFNAVLKQYNVLADRGTEKSKIFEHQGLLYRILDNNGNPVGIPIKASSFYNKPTLKFLETKFQDNQSKKAPFKTRIKNAIDTALINKKITLNELIDNLKKQGIVVALRQKEAGMIYGITYVDHKTKCVFNGSAIGKNYSAKAIQERCGIEINHKVTIANQPPNESLDSPLSTQKSDRLKEQNTEATGINQSLNNQGGLLQTLMEPEQTSDYLPNQLKKKKRRKKRRNNNNL